MSENRKIRKIRKIRDRASSGMSTPELSIVVCSYNGADRLGDCLDALKVQTAAARIEIIVVDDGSNDATTFIAETALQGANLSHRIVTLASNAGLSAARNAGVAAATAPLIAFTDDDCVPATTWAEQILAAWDTADDSVHGIGGPVAAHATDTFNRRFLDAIEPLRPVELGGMHRSALGKIRNYLAPRREAGERYVDSYVGANMSFRRSSIDAVDGFDPSIRFGGDEQYLCRRLVETFGPAALVFDPSIVMHHEFHTKTSDTLRRAKAYGRGNGRNWATSGGFPSLLPGPAFVALATVLAMLISPIAGIVAFIAAVNLLGRAPLQAKRTTPVALFETLTYPYLVLATELVDNVGFLCGALAAIRSRRSTSNNEACPVGNSGEAAQNAVQDTSQVMTSGRFALGGWVWLAAASIIGALDLGWPGQLFVVATLVLLPGSAVMARLGYRPDDLAARVLTATGTGLSLNMAVGLVTSWLGPRLGLDRPLDRLPATATALVVCSVLLLLAGRCDPLQWIRGRNQTVRTSWVVGLLTLPAMSALFAMRLNNGGSGTPAFLLLVVMVVLVLVTMFATWSSDRGWPVEGVVASVSLALAWSSTLRGFGLFGWDIQKELGIGQWTVAHGAWAIPSNGDAYASMLSLTVVPAQFHAIAGVSIMSSLRWIFPIFLAITAAGVLAAARRRANPGPSLLALLLVVIGTPSFARQIPAIGRQEVAFLLVACLLLAVTDHRAPIRARRGLAVITGIGLGYSHYTTAYVTCFFLAVVMVLAPLIGRRRGGERRVLTAGICLAIIGTTFLWNGVLTRPGTELTEAQATLTTTGVRFLDNEESSFWKSWLGGTGVRRATFDEYRTAIVERRDELGWVVPDARAAKTHPSDAEATAIKGHLPQLRGAWYLGTALLRQIVTLLTVIALIWYLRRLLRRHPDFDTELMALGIGAFLIAALLRVSSTVAALYNPERAAIHAGLVFTLILATFFTRYVKRISVPTAMAVLLLVGAWGVAVPVFGGGALASYSQTGEDVERYVTTPADTGTAQWIASSLPYSANVHADRYGRVVLLSHEFEDKFTIIDVVDPFGVDKYGYIFFTSMNRGSDRARGQIGDDFSVFTSPEPFFKTTRAVVYATEETRVYR